MTHPFVELKFLSEGDGTGRLSVCAEKEGFSGNSSAWVGESELVGFGQKLKESFPLQNHQEITFACLCNTSDANHRVTAIAIRVYAIGATGAIGVRVTLTSTLYAHERADSQRSVSLEIITRYGPLHSFGEAICSLVQGVSQAILVEYEP